MTDRELLELAAKAAGFEIESFVSDDIKDGARAGAACPARSATWSALLYTTNRVMI